MSTPAAVSPDATFALKFPSELAIPLAAVGVSDIPTISMMIPPINGEVVYQGGKFACGIDERSLIDEINSELVILRKQLADKL